MKHAFLIALLLFIPLIAQAAFVPQAPDIKASSYVLMDYASGDILAARKPNQQEAPASLTKLMTMYITFDLLQKGRLHLDDKVHISEKAWRTGIDGSASRMFVEVGDRVPVDLLIRGVIVDSGNDASIALAEHIAGSVSSFAGLMNQYAKRLGMTHSHFVNADGLPADDHYSSAEDLAHLARHLIRDFPEYYHYFSQKSFIYDNIKQYNRVHLLFTDPSVDGLKTGYTKAAGYCELVSAKRDGRRLISIVMGTPSEKYRNVANEQLLNYGFRFFETDKLLGKDKPALDVRVYKGAAEQVPLGTVKPVYLGLPHGSADKLKIVPQIDARLVAPIALGQQLGSAAIKLGDKTLRTVPLVALKAVPEGSFFHNVVDQIKLWIKG